MGVATTDATTEAGEEMRIVSVGGDLTEIVFALGHFDDVVARDSTSLYPESVQDLPDVGYVRSLGAESILSMSPSLIIETAKKPAFEASDRERWTLTLSLARIRAGEILGRDRD